MPICNENPAQNNIAKISMKKIIRMKLTNYSQHAFEDDEKLPQSGTN